MPVDMTLDIDSTSLVKNRETSLLPPGTTLPAGIYYRFTQHETGHEQPGRYVKENCALLCFSRGQDKTRQRCN